MDKWILEDKNYQKLVEMVLERKYGQLYLEGKLPPKLANTLIFDSQELKADYFAPSLKHYEFVFKKRNNPFLLLEYLARRPKQLLSAKDLVECLNKPKSNADQPLADRRVRDTIKQLRKMSGLSEHKDDDCFVVQKGYKLKCSVVLI